MLAALAAPCVSRITRTALLPCGARRTSISMWKKSVDAKRGCVVTAATRAPLSCGFVREGGERIARALSCASWHNCGRHAHAATGTRQRRERERLRERKCLQSVLLLLLVSSCARPGQTQIRMRSRPAPATPTFSSWLVKVFNRVDSSRVKLIGPERFVDTRVAIVWAAHRPPARPRFHFPRQHGGRVDAAQRRRV